MKKFRFDNSLKLYKEAFKIIPAGVGSNARLWKDKCTIYSPCTMFIKKAIGPHIWDVDDNRYIDYRLGYGPVILGHSNKKIRKAVHYADKNGVVYAADNKLIIEVAKLVKKFVPSIEMIRFTNSGTEATMAALRVARAFTKKDKIIKFEGHYHGWHDVVSFSTKPGYTYPRGTVPASLGIPIGIAAYTIAECDWNNFESIEHIVKKNHDNVAAIITEPVMGNAASIPPKSGYLQHLRELCDRYNIVLIFDEVKTGFRLAKGGAQEVFKVKPDISTFAKSLGNGYPIAAFGGKKEIMELIGPGKVMHGGTYSANPISLTAAETTLIELKNSEIWRHLYSYGKKMMKGIDNILCSYEIPHIVHGFPTMFQFLFTEKSEITNYRELRFCDLEKFGRLQYELLKRGVMIDEDNEETIFTSYAHSDTELTQTLEAFENAVSELK